MILFATSLGSTLPCKLNFRNFPTTLWTNYRDSGSLRSFSVVNKASQPLYLTKNNYEQMYEREINNQIYGDHLTNNAMQKTAIMISKSLQNHSIILSTLLSAVDYLASPKMMCTCDIPVNQLPARPSVEPSSVKTTTTTTTVGPLRTTIPTTTTTGAPKPAKSDSFDFFEDIPACKLLQLTRRDIWVIFNLPRSCSFISNLCTFPILQFIFRDSNFVGSCGFHNYHADSYLNRVFQTLLVSIYLYFHTL